MPGDAREAGLSLVEMLVVLAIIGVLAGSTVLGIGAASRGSSIETEARQLASRLQLAADEAMISDRSIAFVWDDAEYGFLLWDGEGWRPGEGEGFARHRLPSNARIDAGNMQGPLPLGVDGAGQPVAIRLGNAPDGWTIRYDGLRAVAAPDVRP